MKIDKIAFEQLFPTGVYANQRLRVEISLEKKDFDGDLGDEPETIKEVFFYAKQLVNDAFEKMNPQITWSDPKQVREEETIDDPDKALIDTMNYCTSASMLEKFRPQVERRKNEAVTATFEKLLKELP